jgi:hypothetical protein
MISGRKGGCSKPPAIARTVIPAINGIARAVAVNATHRLHEVCLLSNRSVARMGNPLGPAPRGRLTRERLTITTRRAGDLFRDVG